MACPDLLEKDRLWLALFLGILSPDLLTTSWYTTIIGKTLTLLRLQTAPTVRVQQAKKGNI